MTQGTIRNAVGVFLLLAGSGSPVTGPAAHGQAPAPQSRPLNIIVILVDDMGWSDLGCYGNTFHETPHIDRLVERGMKFPQAYAACCVCSPSRAALLTGKYPARLKLTDYIGAVAPKNAKLKVTSWTPFLPAAERTLASMLKAAGYLTGIIGKWHLSRTPNPGEAAEADPHAPSRHGFDVSIAVGFLGQTPDYFFPYQRTVGPFGNVKLPNLEQGQKGEYLTDRLTTEAEKFIDTNKDRPFFLYLPHYAPHTAIGARLQGKPEVVAKYEAKAKAGKLKANPTYAAMVESLDDSVGRIVRKLESLKIAEQTLIIFTSDNGGYAVATTNFPLRGAKSSAYEGGVRVPLIVCWPGVVKAGSVCTVPVSGVDFQATILEATGVKMPADQVNDGESLVPLLRGAGQLRRQALFWHYPHYGAATTPYGAVRKGDFKLIEFFETGKLELYDLGKDIGESKDLAESMPARTQELQELLRAWRRDVGAQMPTVNPDYKK